MTAAETATLAGARRFPARPVAAAGLGLSWVAVAAAETLLTGGLDALDDVTMIGEHAGTITTAGLLHLLGAVLLGLGLAGSAALAWASRWSQVGWTLTMVGVPCLGAFAMLHLLAVETAASGLDGEAMNQFLIEQLSSGVGGWAVPVGIFALVTPLAVVLLLVGLARSRSLNWWPAGVTAAGMILHLIGDTELLEALSHWMIAAGLLLAGWFLLRGRTATDAR